LKLNNTFFYNNLLKKRSKVSQKRSEVKQALLPRAV